MEEENEMVPNIFKILEDCISEETKKTKKPIVAVPK